MGDPGWEKSVQLGIHPVVGANWGNLLGRTGGKCWYSCVNTSIGSCVLKNGSAVTQTTIS